MLQVCVASLIAAIAVWFDCRERRIPNPLVFTGMTVGLIIGLLSGGIKGLGRSCLGMIVGVGILFIPFSLGWIGAGDAKLLGAIGALLGAKGVALSMLYGAITGGLMSAIVLLRHRRLGLFVVSCLACVAGLIGRVIPGTIGRSLRSLRQAGVPHPMLNSGLAVPYSVAISIGMVIAVVTGFSIIGF
jgi:prepilin peptidase CpaA